MYRDIQSYIQQSKGKIPEISEKRKVQLKQLAGYIKNSSDDSNSVKLTFICTHNSRRSLFCQIWSAVMAEYLGLNDIESFSGGTEATAFNLRAVSAIERAGFKVEDPGDKNPRYKVFFDEEKDPLICFSKTFDDSYNPMKDFAAIMTCTDADKNCPFVPGANRRFSIPYVDPKESDNTPREKETYDRRCRQIATEMYYLMSHVK